MNFSKVVSSPLAQLPESIRLGDGLGEPLSYDATSHKLTYTGFMTRASYDYLRSFSNDGEYQDALLYLFVNSSKRKEKEEKLSWSMIFLVLMGIVVVALTAIKWWLRK